MDVVILCGGLGTRLRTVVSDRPKVMADVAGRPFLEWLLIWLRREGIRSVVLATGYLAGHIESRFRDGEALGMDICYSREDVPLGTGGALRRAIRCGHDDLIAVLNGDTYPTARLDDLGLAHRRARARATVVLTEVPRGLGRGVATTDPEGWISTFDPSGSCPGHVLASAGTCLFEREVVESIADDAPTSLEVDVLPALVGRGLLGVVGDGPLIDIGQPEDYAGAAAALTSRLSELDVFDRSVDERRRLHLAAYLAGGRAVQRRAWSRSADSLLRAVDMISGAFRTGGRLLLCGNGGAAAASQHVAAELVGRLNGASERGPLPALALTADTSVLTALGNDYGFEAVFERQVRALGTGRDVLLAISTSGASPNVLRAVAAARELGMGTIAMCAEGGPLQDRVDCAVIVPCRDAQRVQEALLPFQHALCQLVEADALT